MLRGVVGDASFFDILSDYRATHAYGAVTTLDFQAVAESVSGLDLGTFFDQWVFEPGAPTYRSSFANVSVNGQAYVEVYLEQTQSLSYPTYDMPVTLRFVTGAGTVNASVRNDARSEHLLVPVPASASSIALDPDLWILKAGHTTGAYVVGPPKIIGASPAPDDVLTVSAPAQLSVAFLRDVQINASLIVSV